MQVAKGDSIHYRADVPHCLHNRGKSLAEATEGLSFADLTSLLREAALNVLRQDRDDLEVTWADLEASLRRFDAEVA